MHGEFRALVDSLDPKFHTLMGTAPVAFTRLPRSIPQRGIYLFSEGEQHLYVGRTDGIRKRLQNHCRPGGTHFTATLAFRIARHDTKQTTASYTPAGSRAALCLDPVFGPAFVKAKQRVAAMDIRFVEEPDPVRQALLEIYVATVLKTPYNDIDNH